MFRVKIKIYIFLPCYLCNTIDKSNNSKTFVAYLFYKFNNTLVFFQIFITFIIRIIDIRFR